MIPFILLCSTVYSGIIVGARIAHSQSVHPINLAWFAGSVGAFALSMGWLN